MSITTGWTAWTRGLFADNKGPWGPSGSDGDEPPPAGNGGPWTERPQRGRRPSFTPGGNVASIDDFLRRSRARFGGDGGFPGKPDRALLVWGALALTLLWLLLTT
ncbi:MAG: hypothetical protein ABIW16_06920, partial [Sphingomicrobium sp.]